MITFPVAVTKIPDKKELKGVGFFLPYSSRECNSSWRGVVSGSHDITSVAEKQRLMGRWCAAWDIGPWGVLPEVKESLILKLSQSRDPFIDTPRDAFPRWFQFMSH